MCHERAHPEDHRYRHGRRDHFCNLCWKLKQNSCWQNPAFLFKGASNLRRQCYCDNLR
eukprot:UN23941